jgi:plastocyanin
MQRSRAMMRRDFLKASALAAAGALAGSSIATEACAGEGAVIALKGARMQPDRLTVKKGQSITVADRDNTSHSIYSETPGMELLCPVSPLGTGVIKFETAGIATVECAEHPTEICTVFVV